MTYKEKMEKEHPVVDKDFMMFSCPGDFFFDAPNRDNDGCTCKKLQSGGKVTTCYSCWMQQIPEPTPVEIPSLESPKKALIDAQKVAARVKEVYDACRDEGLNHQEAFEITKIIIAEEVRHGLSVL